MPELRLITSPEPFPFADIMPKPFPKLRARSDFFQPQINACFCLGQTARPESIHKDARTVKLVRRFIHSLDLDIHVTVLTRLCTDWKLNCVRPVWSCSNVH